MNKKQAAALKKDLEEKLQQLNEFLDQQNKQVKVSLVDRVKAAKTIQEKFEICCEDRGISPDDAKFNTGDKDTQCYERLKLVSLALNKGKVLKARDTRYWPYFYKNDEDVFVCDADDGDSVNTFSVSPLVSVETSELAIFSGNEFLEYWQGWHNES